VMPIGSVKPIGDTEIDTIEGAVTVTVSDPETPFRIAVMDAVPAETPVTAPLALTVATAIEEHVQVTSEVRSAMLPSL
jgi:hypothetical protein